MQYPAPICSDLFQQCFHRDDWVWSEQARHVLSADYPALTCIKGRIASTNPCAVITSRCRGPFLCQRFQAYTSLLPSSMNPTPYFQPNCPCHHEPQPCKYTHTDNHPPANRECLSHLVFGQFPLMRMIIPMPVLFCVAATSRAFQRRAPRRGEDGGGCPAVDNEEREDEG
jgi:hypothetical protein